MGLHTPQAKRKRRKRKSDGIPVGVTLPEHDGDAVRSTSVSKQPREMSKRAWKRNKRAAKAAAEEKPPSTSNVAEANEALGAIDTTTQALQLEQDALGKTVTSLPAVSAKGKRRKHARNTQNESGLKDVKLDHGSKAQNSITNTNAGAEKSQLEARGAPLGAEAVSVTEHISTIATMPLGIEEDDTAIQTQNVDAKHTWNLSEPSAGSFLDMHPIFSQDGE